MSPGALTRLAKSAENLFERVEHRTPDVTPPRPRSAPPNLPSTTPGARGFRPNQTTPQWVYRADTRPPGQVFANGFSARPANGSYDYDLRRHQQGGSSEQHSPTGFISTTSDPRVTPQWGQDIRDSHGNGITRPDPAGGSPWRHREQWTYEIRPNPHMIEANAQDAAHRYDRMDGQSEFAAPHHIDGADIRSATYEQRWERTGPGGVEPYPHQTFPDGAPAHVGYREDNPAYDPQHRSYDPDADPASGWRRR